MHCLDIVSSRLIVLPLAFAMFACGSGAEQESVANSMQHALSSKPLDTGETSPRGPAPDSMVKEAIDLRSQSDSGDMHTSFVLYSYTAKFTNNATVATSDIAFNLTAGQTITLGTCGVNGASGTGNTYLRLYNPIGTQVALNDNACGGLLSQLTYTATATGMYTLRAGCSSSTSCSGTVGYSIGNALFSFTASFTNNATNTNTPGFAVTLNAGDMISFGTCGVPGASGSGDTYLRMFDPSGVQVAYNDDNCGGGLSQLSYTVPVTGTYSVLTGCYADTACSGTVGYRRQ